MFHVKHETVRAARRCGWIQGFWLIGPPSTGGKITVGCGLVLIPGQGIKETLRVRLKREAHHVPEILLLDWQ